MTRERVLNADVPEVYGDPALLIPQLYDNPVEKKYDVGIVPHYVDYDSISAGDAAIKKIDVREPWKQVIDEIRSCDVILSSSLHGLIVAEAYGLPATWIRVTDRIIGGNFKFNDYYASTGRDTRGPEMWGIPIDTIVSRAAPPATFDPKLLLEAALRLPRLRS